MKLSIAMCTYNGASYLYEQLDSFSKQTRLPDELVIYDDCSKDETVEIIRKFAAVATFPVRIHINNTNLGTTKNFNNAINDCQGDIILLSDQDDIWMPEKLRMFESVFQKDAAIGLVFCDADLVDENLKFLKRRNWESVRFTSKLQNIFLAGDSFSILLYHNVISGCSMAFRAKYKNIILPIPENLNLIVHDHWIGLLLSSVAKIGLLKEPLVKYRQHPKQQIGVRGCAVDGLKTNSPSYFLKHLSTRFNTKYSFEDILERLEIIRQRIIPISDGNALSKKVLDDVGKHITHLRSRTEIKNRLKESLPIIIKELVTLRYHRYSNGIRSAIKDLIS